MAGPVEIRTLQMIYAAVAAGVQVRLDQMPLPIIPVLAAMVWSMRSLHPWAAVLLVGLEAAAPAEQMMPMIIRRWAVKAVAVTAVQQGTPPARTVWQIQVEGAAGVGT
jgi:hypothetical protein